MPLCVVPTTAFGNKGEVINAAGLKATAVVGHCEKKSAHVLELHRLLRATRMAVYKISFKRGRQNIPSRVRVAVGDEVDPNIDEPNAPFEKV